ncbi:Ribosome-recycling factor [Rickettsiales endosymbiont of Paramecium tredecaurelia]|uniref:ribosome recycling factor n=1 Tax=Candidatus Sarmatiella mevalonica TaxID=2770581 RepID=UPI001923FCAC|nr:ribosome recycling factor [Candidatus Sarmatiella mevalonica]MBL3284582.1 Ribosome-recycling factor [Candidatus Sarmatiella mevalonica]
MSSVDHSQFFKEISGRMENTLKVLDKELKGLRTSRASVNFLDAVQVEIYGGRGPVSQVGTVSTPDSQTILVQVWDKALVKSVARAISDANLGVTPMADGQMIRMVMPPLTEERRRELVKLGYKYSEDAKVAVRNVRRDANDELKRRQKNKELSEDELKSATQEVQVITDKFISEIDKMIKEKEIDVMRI